MNEKSLEIRKDYLNDLANTQQLCNMLMKTPHYSKMGAEGIFAIVSKSVKIGIDPMEALNGGMYYVRGKVEMSSQMMNALIREGKHSITKDKRSNDTICILHGKRFDTGDTWTESYSIEDATRAGLITNPTWKSHPRSMLFARALSLLARQLFPDVIRGCYVEGEIAFSEEIIDQQEPITENVVDVPHIDCASQSILSEEQINNLNYLLDQVPTYKATIEDFLLKKGILNFAGIPVEMYEKIVAKAQEKISEDIRSE